ncbi:2-C-methyl-D-erythritol 4-phosphate cytidylyltransferase [Conservatibacter flavescens]|uniref:2-C-methyl-D-erythritol 4-phosphate cytidylyltransferase n=1 Tax=Conservatibacter flavescens TaxID=28161 RepID=A0A2M8S499_9PAST|nr:2-C-methyl-D-erythritol 4-phosphate cytidylyltransferase [Conservatibacter flavescens]PJG85970.1 2-C-methyl-D-erythritol 4-phosphate cytidylyltransferase [Conservatibacter flavescens]
MTALSRNIIAVVPAAGVGSRMQADRPKQYLMLHGKTVLEHTLQRLLDYPIIEKIILAIAPNDRFIGQLPIIKHPKIQLVQGGETRADSVFAGLCCIENPEQTWALVHDAARPCLRHEDLDKLLAVDDEHGGILAIPAVDTIKRAVDFQRILCTEDRSQLWLALTPQFFNARRLLGALKQAKEAGWVVTDEASAMEFAGFQPHLVAGRSDNIKITRSEDLALAEFYLGRR